MFSKTLSAVALIACASLALPSFASDEEVIVVPTLVVGNVNGQATVVPPLIDIGIGKPGQPRPFTATLYNDTGTALSIQDLELYGPVFLLQGFQARSQDIPPGHTFNIHLVSTGAGTGLVSEDMVIRWSSGSAEVELRQTLDMADATPASFPGAAADFETGSWPTSFLSGPAAPYVHARGALSGDLGLVVSHSGPAVQTLLRHHFPDSRTLVRMIFKFDPNGFTPPHDVPETIAAMVDLGMPIAWAQVRRRTTGKYELRALLRLEDGSSQAGAWIPIEDRPEGLTFDWWPAAGDGTYEGVVRLRKRDGASSSVQTPSNRWMRVNAVRFGSLWGVVDETEGETFFDDIKVNY